MTRKFNLPLAITHTVDTILEELPENAALWRVCIIGMSGWGKTVIAKHVCKKLAADQSYDYIGYISANDVVGFDEKTQIKNVLSLYNECLLHKRAVLVIDDVDIVLGYNSFSRYVSNGMYQLLLSILSHNQRPTKNFIVLLTSPDMKVLDNLEITDRLDLIMKTAKPRD